MIEELGQITENEWLMVSKHSFQIKRRGNKNAECENSRYCIFYLHDYCMACSCHNYENIKNSSIVEYDEIL